ncbi:MAG: hypothetical protein D6762_08680 [Candidatus Neomarinimicrobiota bacterium]|nr:MAG: hypothetical protein D6762_08680 [Candidatus Neomarinimicrobiota bacterium]
MTRFPFRLPHTLWQWIVGGSIVLGGTRPAWVPQDFHLIDNLQGLSQNTVYAMAQDSLGFLWFGTEDGLNRYDGYQFRIFRPDYGDPYAIRSNSIQELLTDHEGTVWIGTDDAGLMVFDPRTEHFYQFPLARQDSSGTHNAFITALCEDRKHRLWIGGNVGLERWNPADSTFLPSSAVTTLDPQGIYIHTILEDRDHSLWLGSDRGLLHYDPDKDSLSLQSGSAEARSLGTVYALAQDAGGSLWIGSTTGLFCRRTDGRLEQYNALLEQGIPRLAPEVYSLLISDSLLWVGSLRGLGLINLATETQTMVLPDPKHPQGLRDHIIYSLFRDREGVVWLGTGTSGLQNFDSRRRKFRYEGVAEEEEQGLLDKSVFALTEGPDRKIWIGAEEGLDIWDPETGTHTWWRHEEGNPRTIQNNSILHVETDRNGRVWIATDTGLDCYTPATGQIDHFRADTSGPGIHGLQYIYDVDEDRDGYLWLASYGGGLNRFDPKTGDLTRFVLDSASQTGSGREYLMSVLVDSKHRVWAGSDGQGAYCLHPDGRVAAYPGDPQNPRALGSASVLCFYEDPSGAIWIGTHGGGLHRLDPETGEIKRYTTADGLPNNVVYGILPDDSRRLWFSTNHGLVRFDPSTGSIRTFDQYDGLQSPEFNQGAYGKRHNGELVFGGVEGINLFDPQRIPINDQVPPIVFTGFSLFGEPQRPGHSTLIPMNLNYLKRLKLTYRQNDFSIAFAALSFSIPEKNQYRYRLDGYDPGWTVISGHPVARYMNIAPGHYTFRVQGSNNDGIWNTAGRSLEIIITPPFWNRWWFRTLLALGLFAGLVLFYLYRIREERERQERLEQDVKERTRALERTNQDLRQTQERLEAINTALKKANENKVLLIDTITHDIRTPLGVMTGMAEVLQQEYPDNEMVQSIVKSGDFLAQILDDAIAIAQISLGEPMPRERLDLAKVLAGVREHFQPALAKAGMELEWDVEPRLVAKVNIIIRAIFTNYISNAIKYARQGKYLKVLARKQPSGTIYVAVIDRGVTLDEDTRTKVFERGFTLEKTSFRSHGLGLSIAKRIAEEHGAEVGVEPNLPTGNVFYLKLPPADGESAEDRGV